MVFRQSHGQRPLTQTFATCDQWTRVELPWSRFEGTDAHDVTGIAFVGGPMPGAHRFAIDEVAIQ